MLANSPCQPESVQHMPYVSPFLLHLLVGVDVMKTTYPGMLPFHELDHGAMVCRLQYCQLSTSTFIYRIILSIFSTEKTGLQILALLIWAEQSY